MVSLRTVPVRFIPEWQTKLKELSQTLLAPKLVSSPFFGYKPLSFDGAHRKILYVGKATAGNPGIECLAHVYQHRSSAFWNYGRRLVDTISTHYDQSAEFAWSNVCKIGVTSGNPGKKLIEKQRSLAVKTLRSELKDLNLSLAVFVCDGFADELIYEAFEILTDRTRARDFSTHTFKGVDFWSRPAMEGFPPALWVKHPQGKETEMLQAWIEQAIELMQ